MAKKKRTRIAIVADDNTGATDAAGMLTSYGARAVLILDPDLLASETSFDGYDVVVVSTRIRSVDPDEAYRITRKILEYFHTRDFDVVQLKYCSTFDSTPRGNIGRSLGAAIDVYKFPSTIVCPALPVNGRTTYMGYHFVNGRLLSESALRNHPLNPMTDSDLVRWLGLQTNRGVGLINIFTIRKGTAAVREKRRKLQEEGMVYHVSDALEIKDIETTVQAYSDVHFLSGGSGVSQALGNFLYSGLEQLNFSDPLASLPPGLLVVSGSESPAAYAQRQYAKAHGFAEVTVHPLAILKETTTIDETAERITELYRRDRKVILALEKENGEDVENVTAEARSLGLSSVETGSLLGSFLGKTASKLMNGGEIKRLLVAGGETSGSVCYECGFRALEVGLNIDPGVPFCFPVDTTTTGTPAEADENAPLIVLKSGNFGAEDLYPRTAKLGGAF